jgi:signal transduction histidine kinase
VLRRVSEALDTVVEPDLAAWTALTAFTAGEGLAFNRAFLLVAGGERLQGWFGVGPATHEEARALWAELRQRAINPIEGLDRPDPGLIEVERRRHADVLGALSVEVGRGCVGWRHAFVGRRVHPDPCVRHWATALDTNELLVVPLMADLRPWGVVLADNFVTHAPIYHGTLEAAETLAHYLRVALERTQLIRRLQEERQRSLEAEHASTLIEAARTIAHDLKNPLAVAGGLAHELSTSPPRDEDSFRRQLGIVAGSVRRAEERVAQLVDRLTSRADGMAPTAVEMGALAERLCAAFRPLADRRGVTVVCYHPSRPVLAAALTSSVERCLENLLFNALEAIGARGGRVQVAVSEDAQDVRLEVADNGPPLPEALRLKPFAGGISTRRGGSGLGLASVRTLVESLGGRVEYDEREPGWVRFTMRFRRWL